jgi:hypothetical protein
MQMKPFIFSIVTNFTEGTTVRTYCPVCGGKDCFTASVHGDAILYNCYKAGCGTAGKVYLQLSSEERIARVKYRNTRPELSVFTKPDYWIDGIGSDGCLSYMQKTHMLDMYKAGKFRPMYDPAERRFVFPIKDNGKVVGGIGRSLVGEYPKTLNYNESYTRPFTCGEGAIGLLVEDCASAVAAARNSAITGVALLGTNIRQDFITHFAKYAVVAICLDPDAYKKSFKLAKQLSPYLKDIRVVKAPNDIKDLNDEDYKDFLYKNELIG